MSGQRAALIVVDLGFGDAGKGLLTDYLARTRGVGLVVRFNGGAQAGHNVIAPDGRHHTFSQFGSGSFVPGVRTHLARAVVVHPTALRVETERLHALGEDDVLARLSVDSRCRVTTPFQQAAGRLRELRRGQARHGSCGVGVGETVSDSLESPELTIHFDDLRRPARVLERLEAQRARKLAAFAAELAEPPNVEFQQEFRALIDPTLARRWLEVASDVARQVRSTPDEELGDASRVTLFEGAQGVLLDEQFGFHPHTTYSSCTFAGAQALLSSWDFADPVERIGVLRAHAVRHGAGPLPTEDRIVSELTREPHNQSGPWQAHVRKGWPDLVLLDYALRACGGVSALALTHLDTLSAFSEYRCCVSYGDGAELELPRSLAEQSALTERLARARPEYRHLSGPELDVQLGEVLAQRLHTPLEYRSDGPTARDVRTL